MAEKPAEAVRAKPDSTLVSAVRAVAEGEADADRVGREHRRGAGGRAAPPPPPAGRAAPGDRRADPARERPVGAARRGANADARAEHLLQFAHMGCRLREEILDVQHADRCGCSRSARRTRRATR